MSAANAHGLHGPWVRAHAPAKLNLQLAVLARRADGYHELETWMAALECGDRLELRACAHAGATLALSGPHASADVPRDATNLALRAAAQVLELARAAGSPWGGFELRLDKQLPSGAGLGGGSADAAAAVLAAERAFACELADERRTQLLAQLGSDCVFFARARNSGLALCKGRGERVEPEVAPRPAWHALVLVPAVHCATAAVYAALATPLSAARSVPSLRARIFDAQGERALRASLFNDLEPAALRVAPELRRWRALLDAQDAAHFRLSGSGSSFFGLYAQPEQARADLDRLRSAARAAQLELRASFCSPLAARAAALEAADS
jgi:4-diphosphocytidyl-2-C-methyl-D-erythritol kinase